jgi:hypothetical protein
MFFVNFLASELFSYWLMKTKINKLLRYSIFLVLPFTAVFVGCDDGPGDELEDAGDNLQEGAEEVGEEIENAAEEVEDGIKDATN